MHQVDGRGKDEGIFAVRTLRTWRGRDIETTRFGIDGPTIIKHLHHDDDRGVFFESFNQSLFKELGLPQRFVQSNVSYTRPNTIRGLHIQQQNPQGKLITCLNGIIQDACVDVRPTSKTYGRVVTVVLDSEEPASFYVPAGWAHGFFCIEESLVQYQCTTLYDQDSDGGINPWGAEVPWMDVHIRDKSKITISKKDLALPSLVDYRKLHS
jgi:dTDP-4-dehydrorhamnose 3,5-epimerase